MNVNEPRRLRDLVRAWGPVTGRQMWLKELDTSDSPKDAA